MHIESVTLGDEDRRVITDRVTYAAPDFYSALVMAGSITMGEPLEMSVVMVDPRTGQSGSLKRSLLATLQMGQEQPTYLMAGAQGQWFAALPLNHEGQARMEKENPNAAMGDAGMSTGGWDGVVKDRCGGAWIERTSWLLISELTVTPKGIEGDDDVTTSRKSVSTDPAKAWKALLTQKLSQWEM